MGIAELKNKIHQQIENSDEKILIQIATLLDNNNDENQDSFETIKALLEISEQEYKEGKTELYKNILIESKEKYFIK